MAICLSLVALSPLAAGTVTASVIYGMWRLAPGALTVSGFQIPYFLGMLLGAAGSSAAALALPVRYWLRIAAAVACLIGAFLVAVPIFEALAFEAIHAAFNATGL